jgi:hypothetical protein
MPRPVTLLLALILGGLAMGLVACGGKSNPHLFSAGRADQINKALDDVRNAVDSHDCATATSALHRLQDQIATLPHATDPRLTDRLQQGAQALAREIPVDCRQTATTPTVTDTTPTTTTTTTTQTTTTATTTTPTTTTQTTTTPTTTTTTTPTTTTTTPTTPGNGGTTTPTTP